jgi:phage-related protein
MPTKVGIHGFSVDKLRRGWRAFPSLACSVAHHDGSDNGTHRSKLMAVGISRRASHGSALETFGLQKNTKFCIDVLMGNPVKTVKFRGDALDEPRAFPATPRREAGYELDKVQNGLDPTDWKPMTTVGQGVREIRIRDTSGAFRVLYVAKFADAVYVLHCFQKKTQATGKTDLDLTVKRYRDLVKELDL